MDLPNFWSFSQLWHYFSSSLYSRKEFMCVMFLLPLGTISLESAPFINIWAAFFPPVFGHCFFLVYFPSVWRTPFSISYSAGCKGFDVFLPPSLPAPLESNNLGMYVLHNKALDWPLSLVLVGNLSILGCPQIIAVPCCSWLASWITSKRMLNDVTHDESPR